MNESLLVKIFPLPFFFEQKTAKQNESVHGYRRLRFGTRNVDPSGG